MLISGLLALSFSFGFAPHQSLWTDETTQLCALSLPPYDLIQYLRGDIAYTSLFDVPPDRTPPLSFLVGKVWVTIFGCPETSLRYLGALFFASASMLTAFAAYTFASQAIDTERPDRTFSGPIIATWMAGLSMATSSSLVMSSVEIRAYPLFLFLSAAALCVAAYFHRTLSMSVGSLLGLILVAAIYTHFFGVILAGAIFSGLFAARMLDRQTIRPLIFVAIAVAACSSGLLLFLGSAVKLSGGSQAMAGLTGFAKLWGRFAASGSVLTIPYLDKLAVAAFTLLFVFAAYSLLKSWNSILLLPLFVALFGLCVVLGAAFIVRGFNPVHPGYNLWAYPVLFVCLAIGLPEIRSAALRNLLLFIWGVWISASLYSSANLVIRGEFYAHGNHPQITRIINALGPSNVTVVHTGSGFHGMAYYPLWYTYRDGLLQYSLSPEGRLNDGRIGRSGTNLDIKSIKTPFVLVAHTRETTSLEIASSITGVLPVTFPMTTADGLFSTPPFVKVQSSDLISMIAVRLDLLKIDKDRNERTEVE